MAIFYIFFIHQFDSFLRADSKTKHIDLQSY